MKLLIQYDLYAMTLNVCWAISKGINPLLSVSSFLETV